ncbi:MAG: SGNH/GDSL hydrolase family protein [Planctomycetaceae bacterium]
MTSRFHASRSDARRRRLRLLLPELQADPVEPLPAPKHTSARRQPQTFAAPEERMSIDRSFTEEEAPGVRTLPALLTGVDPVSWLFVGDSFTPKNVTDPRPWRLYSSRFSGAVQAHFHRPKDVFIDATFPQARLSEVLFEFEGRVAKFQPDICFLAHSLADADSKSIERFERMLVTLIQWSRRFNCQLVVQTPPCLPSRNDSVLTRRLILVESIRGIAAEHGIPLVDHWGHWELTAASTNHRTHWIDADSQTPGEQGHRQLAIRLIKDLKLNTIAKPDFPAVLDEHSLADQ